jgi:hypothetical protein
MRRARAATVLSDGGTGGTLQVRHEAGGKRKRAPGSHWGQGSLFSVICLAR